MMNELRSIRKRLLMGFSLFLLLAGMFHFAPVIQAAEVKSESVTSFGTGKIRVRLYTDYFCAPCRAAEPKIEALLKALVAKNLINVTFIDTPFHRYSSLYARYFLYILNEKRDFEHVLFVRAALFDVAKEEVAEKTGGGSQPERLEEYLKKRGIRFAAFDAKPVFLGFERYLREDKIDHTPSCVIERNGMKETFIGGDDIARALEGLNRGRSSGDEAKPPAPKGRKQ